MTLPRNPWFFGDENFQALSNRNIHPVMQLTVVEQRFLHQIVLQLSEKYGEIFTVQFGPKKIVVIVGYSAVKDALVNRADDFGERGDVPIFKLLFKEKGIVSIIILFLYIVYHFVPIMGPMQFI